MIGTPEHMTETPAVTDETRRLLGAMKARF